MTNPFWNPSERRLRAFWRLVVQLLLIGIAGYGLSGIPFIQRLSAAPGSVLTLAVIVGITWLAARILDRRSFADLGLRLDHDWWADFGFGLALGLTLMTGIFAVEYALGWAVVTRTFVATDPTQPFLPALRSSTLVFLCVGIYEELVSRGYQLTNMAEGLNLDTIGPRRAILLALLLSSLVFGSAHAMNPNASFISTVNIVLAGLMLGLPYVLTGRLGASIGLHITWNFGQGILFGFPVSGSESFISAQIVATDQSGPSIWTGGSFGPEAGLVGIFAMLAGVALILRYTRARYGRTTLFLPLAVYREDDQDAGAGSLRADPQVPRSPIEDPHF